MALPLLECRQGGIDDREDSGMAVIIIDLGDAHRLIELLGAQGEQLMDSRMEGLIPRRLPPTGHAHRAMDESAAQAPGSGRRIGRLRATALQRARKRILREVVRRREQGPQLV